MQNKLKNCFQYPCKFHSYSWKLSYFGDQYCLKQQYEIDDMIKKINCKDFQLAKTCLDCKHSWPRVYETGTIDDIEYRCKLQDDKLIYDDSECGIHHYYNIPECKINKFELEQ